jgi:hypothetical protein
MLLHKECLIPQLQQNAEQLVIAAVFNDCNGDALTPGTQLAKCSDIPAAPAPQVLSINGNTVSLSGGGGSVTVPDQDTDAQQLSISGNVVSLTNGGSITLPTTAAPVPQVLSIAGNTVSLSGGGGSVTVPDNDAQTLSIAGNTLSIAGGNSVTLPAASPTVVTGGAGAEVLGAGTSGSPYVIDVASMAEAVAFGAGGVIALGQTSSFSATLTNPTTKDIRGLVMTTWNAGLATDQTTSYAIYDMAQAISYDGVQDNARSSVLFGGATGGYDVTMPRGAPAQQPLTGAVDATFGTTFKAVTIPAGGTLNVTVTIGLFLLSGTDDGTTYVPQSRQIAFLGIGI